MVLFKDPLALYHLHTTHSISLEFLRAKFLGQFWRVIELSSSGVFGKFLGKVKNLIEGRFWRILGPPFWSRVAVVFWIFFKHVLKILWLLSSCSLGCYSAILWLPFLLKLCEECEGMSIINTLPSSPLLL